MLNGLITSVDFALWWVPRTIEAQTRATHFLGDIIPGSVMMTDWMTCVRESTHIAQIADLTRRVDQLSLFVRYLGRDPTEAYTFDPKGTDTSLSADPGMAGGSEGGDPPLYRPNIDFGGGILTQDDLARVDQFDDPSTFVNDLNFIL